MRKIRYIRLDFENCDTVKLSPDMFLALVIDGMADSRWINCFQYKDGEAYEFIKCSSFEIEVNKKGLSAKTDMGTGLEKRLLEWEDITHISLFFEDNKREDITVPWDGEGMKNERQKNRKTREGIKIEIY